MYWAPDNRVMPSDNKDRCITLQYTLPKRKWASFIEPMLFMEMLVFDAKRLWSQWYHNKYRIITNIES